MSQVLYWLSRMKSDTVLWKLNSTTKKCKTFFGKKPMCEFQYETAINLSKNKAKNNEPSKQSIMESLILAQDERWRRA